MRARRARRRAAVWRREVCACMQGRKLWATVGDKNTTCHCIVHTGEIDAHLERLHLVQFRDSIDTVHPKAPVAFVAPGALQLDEGCSVQGEDGLEEHVHEAVGFDLSSSTSIEEVQALRTRIRGQVDEQIGGDCVSCEFFELDVVLPSLRR
jgi:hypothetical protein